MKSSISLFLLLFYTHILFALSVSATSQPSTCSANGTATATASAGVAPYVYIITGASTNIVSPSVSGSYTFTSLPSGTYTISVTASNSATASVNVTVGGNYQEPTLACSVSGCSISTSVSLGLAPFTYAISSNGGVSFSSPQTSNSFYNLPNGNYVVRVYDACQNFYPCQAQVNVAPLVFPAYTCNSSANMDNIVLTLSGMGGAAPYSIICTTGNNSVTNSTGVFSVPANCDHAISITDACGNNITGTVAACTVPPFAVTPICRNCELGTLSVQGSGGSPPYTYSYNTSGSNYLINNTGNFTGLPPSQGCYVVQAKDACGRSLSVTAACMNEPIFTGSTCPWTGNIDITASFGTNGGNSCGLPANLYPINVTCTSVTPNVTLTQNSTFFQFTGLPYGTHDFVITDNCGEFENISIEPIPLQFSITYRLCDSISATVGLPNTIYTLFDSAGVVLLATDTSGTFGGLQLGTYQVIAYNPICDSQKAFIHVIIDLDIDFDCNTLTAKTCPEDSSYFELSRLNTTTGAWVLVNTANSSTGTYAFNGLVAGGFYRLYVLQLSTGEVAIKNFQVPALNATTVVNCNNLGINVMPYQTGNTYIITNSSGVVVATDTVAQFENLPAGNLTLTVIHVGCDTVEKQIIIPDLSPNYCLVPSSYTSNGSCKAGWDAKIPISYINNYGPFTLTDSLGNIHAYCSGAGAYTNLFPGKYVLSSNCVTDTLKIPQPVIPNFQMSAFAECPSLGKVKVWGYFTPAQWDSIENVIGYDICPYNYFIQLYQNGMQITSANALNFPATTFTFLQLGMTYTAYIYPYPPYYPCGVCAIDTLQAVMPYYAQPDLTSTYGVICGSAISGTVTANVTGGTPPYTYQIISPFTGTPNQTANTSYNFTNLNVGNYMIQVSDKCGISSDYSASVGPLNFAPQYTRNCNGTIQLQVPNITGATYTWQNMAGGIVATTYNPIVPNSGTPQSYIVTVNIAGCSNSAVLNIPMQTGGGVVADAGTDTYVYSSSTSLNAVPAATNATGTWTQISPSSGNTSFANVNAANSGIMVSQFPGTYTYVWTVTDGSPNGCTDKDTVTFYFVTCNTSNPMNVSVAGNSPTCGGNNGTAVASLTGGLGPFAYNWSNGCTTATNTGLSAGNYSVTVTDLSGCFPPVTKPVYIYPTIGANGYINNQIDLLCYGDSSGKASAIATQGTAPFQYNIDNGAFSNNNIFLNLAGGAHTITLQDSKGCIKQLPLSILEPDSLEINLVATNNNCNGANDWVVAASVSGGTGNYTYSWDNGQTSNQIANMSVGTYTVFVTDSNNCVKQKSISINAPASLTVNVVSQTNILCYGANTGSISVNATGGQANYTYSWSNGLLGNNINALAAGTYTVYLTDANNCSASQNITISQANPILVDSIYSVNVSCFGGTNGTAQAFANGGTGALSYSWSNGNLGQNATNLSAGNSILYITDANNCQIAQNVTITQPPTITITNSNMDSVNCTGGNTGAYFVNAAGGTGSLSYSWSNGQMGQNLVNVGAGNYTLFVSDANNCAFSQNVSVLEPLPLQLSTLILSNACDGAATGSVQVTVSGGTSPYFYSWSNGQTSPIATGLGAGTYSVTVTDAKGCKKKVNVSIIPFSIQLVPQNVNCFGGNDASISVNASGNVGACQYSWNTGQTTSSINNLNIGTYSVWVKDTTNCILSRSVNITQPSPLESAIDSLKMIDCFGAKTGTANITVNGGTKPYNYSWLPNPVQNIINPNGVLAHHLQADTYKVWIIDANQCLDSLEFTLTQSPAIVIKVAEIEKAYCNLANGNALIQVSGGNGNFSYSWNSIPSQDSTYLQNVFGGTYKVYVVDEKGCQKNASLSLPNIPPPTTFFTSIPLNNVPIYEYEHIYFQNLSQNAYSYSWDFGDNSGSNLVNPEHIYEYTNSYTVTLTGYDAHKVCPTTFSMTYFILPDGRIFIPSAFSPNGDNLNDAFFVMGTGIIEMELIIFDRWGKVITTLRSPAEVWNGLDANGKPCPEGAYTFKAHVILNNGYRLNRGGTITLFR